MTALLILTPAVYAQGLAELSDRDPDLRQILEALGAPPIWCREPGFPTLVQIILEQQVSLASARAAFDRLVEAASPLTPQKFLEFDDIELKSIGFSRQKIRYCRELSRAILDGSLDLDRLESEGDLAVRDTLLHVKGVGPWTAEIYLLMAPRRPDAWPSGDLALQSAFQKLKRLPRSPSPAEFDAASASWRPWRAVAARLLWHFYLSGG